MRLRLFLFSLPFAFDSAPGSTEALGRMASWRFLECLIRLGDQEPGLRGLDSGTAGILVWVQVGAWHNDECGWSPFFPNARDASATSRRSKLLTQTETVHVWDAACPRPCHLPLVTTHTTLPLPPPLPSTVGYMYATSRYVGTYTYSGLLPRRFPGICVHVPPRLHDRHSLFPAVIVI